MVCDRVLINFNNGKCQLLLEEEGEKNGESMWLTLHKNKQYWG